jgi:hypothetical protein
MMYADFFLSFAAERIIMTPFKRLEEVHGENCGAGSH